MLKLIVTDILYLSAVSVKHSFFKKKTLRETFVIIHFYASRKPQQKDVFRTIEIPQCARLYT